MEMKQRVIVFMHNPHLGETGGITKEMVYNKIIQRWPKLASFVAIQGDDVKSTDESRIKIRWEKHTGKVYCDFH